MADFPHPFWYLPYKRWAAKMGNFGIPILVPAIQNIGGHLLATIILSRPEWSYIGTEQYFVRRLTVTENSQFCHTHFGTYHTKHWRITGWRHDKSRNSCRSLPIIIRSLSLFLKILIMATPLLVPPIQKVGGQPEGRPNNFIKKLTIGMKCGI